MTIFTNFLICAVCSALSVISKGNAHEIDKNLFTFFFRGSFQRLYEALFPKSIAYRLQIKKRKKQLTAEICEIVSHMSENDIAWMHTYFRSVESNLKKKHSLEWESATENVWKNKKNADAYARKMYDTWAQKLDKAESASIQPFAINAEQFVLDMQTVVDGRHMPESVKRIVELIKNYVFELKYLHMSSVNKDLVQVTKFMIEEGNAKLLDDIKEQLDIVAQWNNRSGGDAEVTDVASVAVRDPYCFVRLVCPSCQATGSAVTRYETYAECSVCGERYEIIQNVDREDEIKKLIERKSKDFQDALQKQMGVVLQSQAEQTGQVLVFQQEQSQQLTRQMDELWKQVKHMTYENADNIFKEIRAQSEDGRSHLEKNLEDAEVRLEKMLAERLEQHTQSILAMHKESMDKVQQNSAEKNFAQFQGALNDTLQQVKLQMDQSAQRNERQFDEIKSRMDHYHKLLSGEMNRLYERVADEGSAQTTNICELRKFFEAWTEKMEYFMVEREPAKEEHHAFCPLCRETTPSHDGLCTWCKRSYDGNEPFVRMQLKTVTDCGDKIVNLEFLDEEMPELLDDRPVRIQLFVGDGTVCAVENRIRDNTGSIRLRMRPTVRTVVKREWRDRKILPEQVVLVGNDGELRVNSAFADVLQRELLSSVREVVGGQRVGMSLSPYTSHWCIDGKSFVWREDDS